MITGQPLALLGIVSPMRFSQMQAGMAAVVDEWVNVELVVRFGSSLGPVLFFKGFLKQQTLKYSRERPSQFPCPPGYIRTAEGLRAASDVPWVEGVPCESGFLAENPAKGAVLPESEPQQQQQQEQQQQQQQEQQQQADAAEPAPAAGAAAADAPSEAAGLLAAFGASEPALGRLAGCRADWVRGWMWETERPGNKIRDPVAFVIARLKARERPPRPMGAAEWAELHAPEPAAPDVSYEPEPAYVPQWAPAEVSAEAETLWRTCVGELQLQVTPDVFETYLHPLRPGQYSGGTLDLHAPNEWVGQWLDLRLRRPVERSLAAISGEPVKINVRH
jgi:hypothetical protein